MKLKLTIPFPRRLRDIAQALSSINERLTIMSTQLETLTARVTAIESVGDSAIALLAGLKADLDEAIASGDADALTALSERLGAQAEELAAAVVANTPAAL